MHAFLDPKEGGTEPRSHPWDHSLTDPRAKYADFLKEPHRIRTDLEDFVPYAHFGGIEQFYQLLEWMNGRSTIWETTECFFRPPAKHTNNFFAHYALMCSGRIVFFCRDHQTQRRLHAWIRGRVLHMLVARKPDVPNACVAVFEFPVQFTEFGDGQTAPVDLAVGTRFFGFGNTDEESFDGFGAAADGVRGVLGEIAEMLIISEGPKP